MNQQKKAKNRKASDKTSQTSFFNSPIPIIVALVILVVFMMFYNRYLTKSTSLYTFSGFDTDMSILNGTIYTSRHINSFGDSKVIYKGDDIALKNFEIGYYIKEGTSYREISVIKAHEDLKDEKVNIKELIETSDFSFTETSKEAEFMSKENMKNIEHLIFRIVGTDSKDEKVDIEIPLEVTKISK